MIKHSLNDMANNKPIILWEIDRQLMPIKNNEKMVKDLDHAFELTLILSSLISGIMAQYVSVTQEITLPLIIGNLQRLSIVFVFPLGLTILIWIASYFANNESWKMYLRTYAWSSMIFEGLMELIMFFVICPFPMGFEYLGVFVFGIPFWFGIFLPLIPLLLIIVILQRYRIALETTTFFSRQGIVPTLLRYTPFTIAYILFWLVFFWGASI